MHNKWMYDLVNYIPTRESEVLDSDTVKPCIPTEEVLKGSDIIESDLGDLDFMEDMEPDVYGSIAEELAEANQKALDNIEHQFMYETDVAWKWNNRKYMLLAQKEANKLRRHFNKAIWQDIDQEAQIALIVALEKYEPIHEHEHEHTHEDEQDLSCGHVHDRASYPQKHTHKHEHKVSVEYWIAFVVKRMVLNFLYAQKDMAGISTRVRSFDQKILNMFYGDGEGDIDITAAKLGISGYRVKEVFYRPTIGSLNFYDENIEMELIDNIIATDENNFSRPTGYCESLLIEALSVLTQEELILVSIYNEIVLPNKYTIVLEQNDFGGIETTKDAVSFEMIAKHLCKPKTSVIRNYKKALKKLLVFYSSKAVDNTS